MPLLKVSYVNGAQGFAHDEIPLCGLSPAVPFLKCTSVLACKLAPHLSLALGASEHEARTVCSLLE